MMDSGKPERLKNCLDCGTEVDDQFCPHCGQSTRDIRVSLSSLFYEYFGYLFNIDSKLMRTFRSLMLQPGMLTHEYIAGKRSRYLTPIRIYFVSSLLFFLSSQHVMQHQAMEMVDEDTSVESKERQPKATDLAKKGIVVFSDEEEERLNQLVEARTAPGELEKKQKPKLNKTVKENTANPGAALQERGENPSTVATQDPESPGDPTKTATAEGDGKESERGAAKEDPDPTDLASETSWERFERRLEESGEKLSDMSKEEIIRKFIPMILEASSTGLLLLLPLFALCMKLLYIRRDPLYLDHLIFALIYHSFLFFFLMALMWWSYFMTADVGPPIFFAIILIVPIYLYKSMRLVYGQSRLRTGLKLVAILSLHMAMLLGLSMISIVYAMLTLA